MFPVRTVAMIFICGVLLVTAGCGPKKGDQEPVTQAVDDQVSCIGVLPAGTPPVAQGAAGEARAKILRQGATVMDGLLQEQLRGQARVRLVGHDLLAGMALTGGESPLALARKVGERIGCNAILETEVSRYSERVGGKYSAEKPASVAFAFRLLAVQSGSVLWSATFDEAQAAVTDNIYEWNKAKSRGFHWVEAEALMREGVKAKLDNSPYFQKPVQAEPAQGEPATR